jgi:hypothetical protein
MKRILQISLVVTGVLLCLVSLSRAHPGPPSALLPGSGLYSLEAFGPIKTPVEAAAAYAKALAAIQAGGGGTLLIPGSAPADWSFGNNSQTITRMPAAPAPAKQWKATVGVTVVDTRGGTLRVLPPQVTGMEFNRTFQLPAGQSAPHWSYQPMLNFENNVVRGSTSYLDYLQADTPKGVDAKFYVPTIRGLFTGMFINAHTGKGYGGSVERLYIKSLGYDKAKGMHYFVADAEADHVAGAIVHNKTHVNVVKMETRAHTELQTFDFFNERHHYSQGDSYLFDGRFYYMGNVHSAAGDENGVVYAAFVHGETDIFRGTVEKWDAAKNELIFKGAANASTLGSGRPLINLNPKKWITAGTVQIVRPASFIDVASAGTLSKDPVFGGKTYPTTLITNARTGVTQLAMGGLIRFSADAPITKDAVGRYFAINEPTEKVKGSLCRWYLISSLTTNADGTKDIKIERHWWGAKEAGAPQLYRDENYSSDGNLKPLKYVIAPGSNVYDVSRGVLNENNQTYDGAVSPCALMVAPYSDSGTPFDFEANDAIEQAIGPDPFHPIPFRAWTFDEVPSTFPAPILDISNNGSVGRAMVMRVAGGDKNGKAAWDSVVKVEGPVNNVINSRGEINGSLIRVDQKNGSAPITWSYDNGKKESKLWVDNKTGVLNYEGGAIHVNGGLVTTSGLSGTETPANNLRGVNVPVPAGQKTLTVTFPRAENDANYAVFLETTWLSQRAITAQTPAGFTVTFSEAVPEGAKLHWTLIR